MNDSPPDTNDDGGIEADPTVPDTSLFRSGRTIGPYVLRERVGEGGMGEVWRADQTAPVRRTVALKLIRPGMDSREVCGRFEAERQALALMNHPCIAKVFDAGTTSQGRPYFAMEYVPGVRINDYCDRRFLSMHERLKLFQHVCDGVQHAHQKSILHRDLKPSNILVTDVDGKPLPKIIDFGVAKAMTQKLTEETMYTAMGQLIGTPEYMSPEQADLTGEDVDTRTDVYSLGVVLYVLLVGALPFDAEEFRSRGLAGIIRILREQDPPRPSTKLSTLEEQKNEVARFRRTGPRRLANQLEGDLDWIVMRCLEKDRNRRYGSAHELSQDIQRHLDDLPVVARPPSVVYRTQKFVRRHRLAVGVTLSALAVLLAFSVTTTIQSTRIAAERDRASHEAAISGEVSGFLTQLFEIADPRESRGNSITAREILDRGAERIQKTEWSDARVQARLVTIMADVYTGLGLREDAYPLYVQALELSEANLGPEDPTTLSARYDIGKSLFARGKYEDAEIVLRETLDAQRRLLDDEDPALANTVQGLARLLRNTGRREEAEALYLEALAMRREVLGERDPLTAHTMNDLGILYWSRGRYDEAEPLLVHSLDIAEDKLGADHPSTLTYRNNMAAFKHTATHWADPAPHRAQAERLYQQCIEAQRRILGSDHPETLRTIFNLGTLLLMQDRLADAEPFLEEAADGRQRVLGEKHRATLLAQINLARTWRLRGRTNEAEALLDQVLRNQREILDPHHREIRFTLSEIFELYMAEGRSDEARVVMKQTIAIHRHDAQGAKASAEELNRYAWTILTCEFEDLRNPDQGLEFAISANQMSEYRNPEYLRTLARAHAMNGDADEARASILTALEILPVDDAERELYEEDLASYESGNGIR